jgi:hypothetical protein
VAKLPVLKSFLAQDYLQAGPWISKFLYTLNLFTGSIYQALNGGLTFQDNMLAQINTLTLTGASPVTSFKWKFASLPIGVVLLNITDISQIPLPITKATTVQWSSGAGIVNVTGITGLESARTYSCTFLTVGG